MRLFLTILEGESPGEAEPILATEDDHLMEIVCNHISDRLTFALHDSRYIPPADGRDE